MISELYAVVRAEDDPQSGMRYGNAAGMRCSGPIRRARCPRRGLVPPPAGGLAAVRSWLTADEPAGQALVITGQPGADKSAILARAALGLEAKHW